MNIEQGMKNDEVLEIYIGVWVDDKVGNSPLPPASGGHRCGFSWWLSPLHVMATQASTSVFQNFDIQYSISVSVRKGKYHLNGITYPCLLYVLYSSES
jgi:hypothetical protein